MNRLRTVFAFVLLCMGLPAWRFLDLSAIIFPHELLFSCGLFLIVSGFVTAPVILLKPKVRPLIALAVTLSFVSLSYFSSPLSNKGTNHAQNSHCGSFTYTGFFYPAHSWLTQAFADDLRLRNQLCWVRKIISRMPARFDSKDDFENYRSLMHTRLLSPEVKYRAVLPLVAFLEGQMSLRWETGANPFHKVQNAKGFVDSLHFWRDHYTFEVSTAVYPWWEAPFSTYIQFEYGLIENHWEDLIDGIEISV